MLVCKPHKFLVILPARCGTTSVKLALKQRFPLLQEQGANHGLRILSSQRNFFKVCLKRNPYSRVLSMWQHWWGRSRDATFKHPLDRLVQRVVTVPQLSFPEFLKQTACRTLLEAVCPPVTKLVRHAKIDLWVDQASLEDDLNKLPALGGERLHLPHRHKSLFMQSLELFYTPELAAVVHGMYHADFEAFGYPKELP
jgi:hypothetical protein